MNVITANLEHTLQETLYHPDQQRILTYLLQTETPPTLRELKQALHDIKVEKQLEKLIRLNLVIRKERRYFSGIPIYHATDDLALIESLTTSLLTVEDTMCIQRLLLHFLAQPKLGILAEAMPYCHAAISQTDYLTMVACSLEQEPLTLPHYFRSLTKSLTYPQLAALIGDVDEAYFMDQISLLLEKIERGRTIRPSIFLTALQQTAVLTPENKLDAIKWTQVDTENHIPVEMAFMEASWFVQGRVLGEWMQQRPCAQWIGYHLTREH